MVKNLYLLLFFLIVCGFHANAQQSHSITGTVEDTASVRKLMHTSVSILNQRDSTLVKFARADDAGKFTMEGIPDGDYILLATYPKYADFVDFFSLDSASGDKDFGQLYMTLVATLLQEVIVQGRQAITIKGDTTEYDAASFVIQPNSKVEDLLKQLPGIQVDRDGKITAQGQTVSKVLVDGEEFFGDDPTLVTQNLRGDMVDKVQLYDKKSDQADFTGVDDGETIKTINIQLKEDQKQGYFGKVDVAGGTDGFYQGQAMANMFKGKKKISAYGTVGNTGTVGLGWEDNDRYLGGGNMSFSDDGVIFISGGTDDFESFNGRYDGRGIPLAATGGLHFDNKWDNDRQSINSNYKIGSLGVEGVESTITQNNLPTGVINTLSDQRFDNHSFRHKLDGIYEIRLDTTSSLKFVVDGTILNTSTSSEYNTISSNFQDDPLNRTARRLINDAVSKTFNASGLWNKRLKKKGRTLSVNISQNITQNNADGFLNSENYFYGSQGEVDSALFVDQQKTNVINNSTFRSNVTYTEPLGDFFSIVFNYGLSINNGTADRRSYNQSASGAYDLLDTLFSNNFELEQLSNQLGAIFNYRKDKTTLNFGSRFTNVNFNQRDLFRDDVFNRRFLNINPQITYQYRFSQQKSMRLSYTGNNTQPNINQIQPVRVNDDPLNIILGNAALRPSYRNSINISFNTYKVLSGQYANVYGGYNFTHNAIVTNTNTDSVGRSVLQYSNLRGKMPSNFYGGLYFGRKVKKYDIDLGMNLSTNGNIFYSIVNDEENRGESYTVSSTFQLRKYVAKKFDVNLNFGPNYSINQSSLQQNLNSNGWGLIGNGGFNIYLPAKFEIGSDASYLYNAPTEAFDESFSRLLLNASVSKKFLSKENLRIRLSVNDLLNQNVGFRRNAMNNFITQNSYTTIRRYFLLSVIWDFNKMGAQAN